MSMSEDCNDLNIKQTDVFKREFRFEVFNKHYLRVKKKNRKKTSEYTVDLISLAPECVNVKTIAWVWLGFALMFVIVASALLYHLIGNFSLQAFFTFVPLSLLSLLLAAASVAMFLYKSSNKKIFVTNYCRYPLAGVILNNPNTIECDRFVEAVEQRIQEAHDSYDISEDKLKAGELKMLRRLREKGVISTTQYEQYKNTIFGITGDTSREDSISSVRLEKA